MRQDCPRFTTPGEWQAYVDTELEQVVLLAAHVEQAWVEAKTTDDDDVRRAAKAPRRRAQEARAFVDKLAGCAEANGSQLQVMTLWKRIGAEVPIRQAQITLPRWLRCPPFTRGPRPSAIRASRAVRLIGFGSTGTDQCLSSPRARWLACPVTTMMGIVGSSFKIWGIASRPPRRGITRSNTTAAHRPCSMSRMASTPLAASSTSCPRSSRNSQIMVRSASSSSATRIARPAFCTAWIIGLAPAMLMGPPHLPGCVATLRDASG